MNFGAATASAERARADGCDAHGRLASADLCAARTDARAWHEADAAAPYVANVAAPGIGRAENAVIRFTDATLQADRTIACLACADLTADPKVEGRVTTTGRGVFHSLAGWQSENLRDRGVRVPVAVRARFHGGIGPNDLEAAAAAGVPKTLRLPLESRGS